MPTSVTCLLNGSEVGVTEAIEARMRGDSPLFQCVQCGERVKPHSGGGHTSAHIEHIVKNPGCPLSPRNAYRSRDRQGTTLQNTDIEDAIEGYARERKYLVNHRNRAVVLQCKERDNYTCKACGFSLRVNGRSVIDCHHLTPLASGGGRVTSVSDLVCLCPNCHRVAHTSNPPLSLDEITKLTMGTNRSVRFKLRN
jgi:HNH endonuclease